MSQGPKRSRPVGAGQPSTGADGGSQEGVFAKGSDCRLNCKGIVALIAILDNALVADARPRRSSRRMASSGVALPDRALTTSPARQHRAPSQQRRVFCGAAAARRRPRMPANTVPRLSSCTRLMRSPSISAHASLDATSCFVSESLSACSSSTSRLRACSSAWRGASRELAGGE
eukprot:364983-Chlamydomonas_euryale.AAC.6